MNESVPVTLKHIKRIDELLDEFAIELMRRGNVHDNSKFTPEEQGPLDEMQRLIDIEGQAPYGTPEYSRRTALLKTMIDHHYARNNHHPEHYEDGVDGMDLFDIIEMFCDWKAASERGEESHMNLSYSKERFKISDQLHNIFLNTVNNLGWKWK